MRIKNFTLMLFAFLVSAVCLAGKPTVDRKLIAYDRHVMAQKLTKQSYAKTGLDQYLRELPAPKASNTAKKAPAKAPEVVTPPSDGEVEYFTLTGTNNRGGQMSRTVKLIWDGLDIVYISGLSYYLPDAFVKGTYNEADETFVFASGQYLGNFSGYDFYFAASSDGKTMADAVANFDELAGTFTFTDYFLLDNGDPKEMGPYAYWAPGVTISPIEGDIDLPVEIPSDLEIETYAYSAYNYFGANNNHQEEVSGNLNIGIYGEDVYIQGMSIDAPQAWIKGTFKNDTTVVFPGGQLLEDGLYFNVIGDAGAAEYYTLIYDPQTGVFTQDYEDPVISDTKNAWPNGLYQYYYGYVIKPITEQAATPAKSLISNMKYAIDGDILLYSLAKVDTEGEGMAAEKLSYILYYEDAEGNAVPVTFTTEDYPSLTENLQEIPATFTDGKSFKDGALSLLMDDRTSWISIGISTVYYGGEERHESEIAWYTPIWPKQFTMPEGLTVTEHTFKGSRINNGGDAEMTVGLAFDGDDIYIRGIGQTNEDIWVKGTKNANGDYVFPNGQVLGNYYDEDRLFFVGYTKELSYTDPILSIDAANSVYKFTTEIIENADYTDKSYYVRRYEVGATIEMAEAQPEVLTPVEIPEGLATEVYSFSATAYFDKVTVAKSVLVGFDGDNVYIQGISDALPEAWMMGTIDGDKVTIPTGQYVGNDGTDDYWTIGFIDGTGVSNYTMDFDEESSTLTNVNGAEYFGTTSVKGSSRNLYDFFYGITIKKVTEKAATPATPTISTMMFAPNGNKVEFNIPVMDVEGDGLIADKLSYKIYYDEGDGEAHEVTFTTDLYTKLKEDMTVIPYGFLDDVDEKGNPTGSDFDAGALYLKMDHNTWKRVGIQSIYTGGDETNASEIGWYTITWPTVAQLPDDAELKSYCLSGTYKNKVTQNFTKEVSVAMVGDSIYVQGVGRANSVAWIKGTKTSEDTYTFSKGQYMGNYGSKDDYSKLFLMGYNSTLGVMDVKMKLDAETGIFTFTTEIFENCDYTDKLYYLTRILSGAQLSPSDAPDAISTVAVEAAESSARYSISGQRVGKNFKGIVIENGKKFFQK